MKSSKKILLISGFRIFPTSTGGHLRSGNIARGLARMGHEVCIYSLAGRQGDYAMGGRGYRVDDIENGLVEEVNLGLGFGLLQALGRRLRLPRVWQYWLLRLGWVPRRLTKAIQAADLVFSDLPWCPPVGIWHKRKPWFLISHNLEYRLLEQGGRWDRMAAHWMKSVEMRAPHTYQDILACAEEDQRFFKQQAPGKVIPLVRNGVDPAVYTASADVRQRVRAELGVADDDTLLIFSGSNFGPNIEALQWVKSFCHQEAAALAALRVKILGLGSMASAPLRDGALIITGRVPEVLPYFAAGDAGFNPIQRGSGANVKLFEYLAARLPVISTAFGVRGTELLPDKDYLLFEPAQALEVLRRFVTERSREQWRLHAEQVWQRQRHGCDIEAILSEVAQQLPVLAPERGFDGHYKTA